MSLDLHRVAMLSVHTSPLDPPGAGDAGGMNVYVVETARRMAERGIAVEIFTRATSSEQPRQVEMADGVTVRNVVAGPFEGLGKEDLPPQMCAFTAGVLRAEARQEPGYYDVVHSHYWLSGQVGWLTRDRWGVPLVHTAHTWAKVKNAFLAEGDAPEPMARVLGEDQVVAESDELVVSTADEAKDVVDLYGADAAKVRIVPPGVDLDTFSPGARDAARSALGLPTDRPVLLFAGRLQPLKAPDLLLRAAAQMADIPTVVIVGEPSGSAFAAPGYLKTLAAEVGCGAHVHFRPRVDHDELASYYRAADLTVVPSYNESFGLVALESQACGTPVVAAAVGGLTTAVADGTSGVLVDGHDVTVWAKVLDDLLAHPGRIADLARGARPHAEQFSWERTTDSLIAAYRDVIAEVSLRAAG